MEHLKKGLMEPKSNRDNILKCKIEFTDQNNNDKILTKDMQREKGGTYNFYYVYTFMLHFNYFFVV